MGQHPEGASAHYSVKIRGKLLQLVFIYFTLKNKWTLNKGYKYTVVTATIPLHPCFDDAESEKVGPGIVLSKLGAKMGQNHAKKHVFGPKIGEKIL